MLLLSPSRHVNSSPGCYSYLKEPHQSVSCFQFNSWSELFSLLNEANLTSVKFIFLFPAITSSLILTTQVWSALCKQLNISYAIPLQFYRLRGISLLETNEIPAQFRNSVFSLSIDQSVVNFFIGDKSQNELECSRDIIPRTSNTILNYINSLTFWAYVKYDDKPVCHFIFANVSLYNFEIHNQIDSFMIKNLLQFQSVNPNETFSMNSTITVISIYGYNFALGEKLLNPLVFEKINEIYIRKSVGSIQVDLFKSFIYLNFIMISIDSLMSFFHQVGIQWTLDLQANSAVFFASRIIGVVRSDFFTYSDEDFVFLLIGLIVN